MVFSSIPAYLDPSNWQQQSNDPAAGVGTGNPRLPPPLPPPPPHVGSGAGSIRPGSMAERARMANIPLPEAALKCPRCESTNTKFCYFNNYSLTQPRHFCKTCRRYWTRGGALRNVPVGGGCRRNKRSKAGGSSNTSSKSPASGDRQTSSGNNSSSAVNSSNSAGTASILGFTPQIPPLRFMAPLSSHLGDHHYGGGEIGLNYGGISISAPNLVATSEMNFQLGSSSLGGCGSEGGGGSYLSAGGGGVEQWRLQPLPQICSLGGLDLQPGLYPFQDGGGGGGGAEPSGYGGEGGDQDRGKLSGSGLISQMASVKMEDNQQELNLSRQFLGIPGNHDQYWSGSYDFSGFSSSSTTSHI